MLSTERKNMLPFALTAALASRIWSDAELFMDTAELGASFHVFRGLGTSDTLLKT